MIFKWVGSKSKLAKEINKHFPPDIFLYVEPFMGAGHVAFETLRNNNVENCILADANDDLISFWKCVKEKPDELYKLIEKDSRRLNKKRFNLLRHVFPKKDLEKAARFYYLVKNSFHGLWRVNTSGYFNVSYEGCNVDNFIPDEEFFETSELLQECDIIHSDFKEVLGKVKIKDNTVVYLDPPYHGMFSSYTRNKFNKHDQIVLNYYFKRLKKDGAMVFMSNSNTDFIHELYDEFNISTIDIRHTVSCTGSQDKTEVLVW